jgi:Zn finger protein HypA/HybF involved in hydrogenase expression
MAEEKSKKSPIIFYCKDCEEVVDTHRVGRKYVYKCKKCGTKNVAFGTEKSIGTFFRLEEKEKKAKSEETKAKSEESAKKK